MKRERILLNVMVDLDPIPGAFHTADSAEDNIQALLLSSIPHYNPVVVLDPDVPKPLVLDIPEYDMIETGGGPSEFITSLFAIIFLFGLGMWLGAMIF